MLNAGMQSPQKLHASCHLLMLVDRPASLSWRPLLPTDASAEAAGGRAMRCSGRGALNHRSLTLLNAAARIRRGLIAPPTGASNHSNASWASVSGTEQTAKCVSGAGCLWPAESLGRWPRATLNSTIVPESRSRGN